MTLEITKDELATMYGGLYQAFEDLQMDMGLDNEDQAEMKKLGKLRDRIKDMLDLAEADE